MAYQHQGTDTNQFLVDSQWVRGTFNNLAPAAYLQDSWRATSGLTVNAGLRWSRQIHKGASGGKAQQFADEWQPRLGFNWHPGRPGSHRVFGSYGRFYQQVPLNLASIFYADSRAKLEHYSADPRKPGVTPDATDDFSIHEADFAGTADGRSADHFDEFTAGYERLFNNGTLLTVRGLRRTLRSVFLVAFDVARAPEQIVVIGTPGEGDLAFLPAARRKYTAIEVSTEGGIRKFRFRGSYVLSRTWGNFSGLYSSDGFFANPGTNFGLGIADQARNSTGLLANDRTHLLKLAGRYSPVRKLEAGVFATWQSGTPLNDFGVGAFGIYAPTFLAPRGSIGRTPAVWDLNLRLAHHAAQIGKVKGKVALDVLHVGNPQIAVRVDQQHYYAVTADGSPTTPNSKYLQPLLFQPPMSARLGVEITF